MPYKYIHQYLYVIALSMLAIVSHAQETPKLQTTIIETDWLEPKAGHEGKSFGARIEKVEKVDEKDITIISVALPENMKEDDIEEVVVLGKPDDIDAEPVQLQQPQKFELYNSPEKNGIIVYLPNTQNFVLRINYYEQKPDVEPDLTSDQN
ncbi:hypothetical protein R50073_26010 [Maricurvus nonylphenolicus]|uniref:hypothetical protein n=1 Tax=Maricurvus nonylphenolicus TaxID=1008307 RepID=UPI0036F311EA